MEGGRRRPRVLISAYACRPAGGSEPGAGWAWCRAAAQDHDVWVLTRGKFAHEIRAELEARPVRSLTVVPLELPAWLLRLRNRAFDVYWYYPLWQLRAGRAARRLHRRYRFDVIHHLTFAVDWMPAGVVRKSTARVIWGPVGGSTNAPWALRRWLGVRGVAGELARRSFTGVLRLLVGRRHARRADLVVAQNQDVAKVFSRHAEVVVHPNVAVPRLSCGGTRAAMPQLFGDWDPPVRQALFVGRLIPWKGLPLAISALADPAAAGWELKIIGDGPDWRRSERLADQLGIRHRVEFLGQVPREEVLAAFKSADALLAPAMREAAGWAVAEALASGCPVVCLDRGGPSVIVDRTEGAVVPWEGDVVAALAKGLAGLSGRIEPVSRWSPDRLPSVLADWYTSTRVTP